MSLDLRRYARETNLRLLIGFVLLLFVVGDGLIWWLYGREAAVLGVVCLLAGLLPLVAIALFLWIVDWIVKRDND